jgi:protein-disulfide isomerase
MARLMTGVKATFPAVALCIVCLAMWHWWVRPTLPAAASAVAAPAAPQDLDGLQKRGSNHATVGIEIFSDFQCPVCGRLARDVLPAVEAKYVETGRAVLIFSDLPLESIHPRALPRAALAECAARQHLFWQTHDTLFDEQTSPAVEQHAIKRLDTVALEGCLASDSAEAVRRRAAHAASLGIVSTPTIFVGDVSDGALRVTRVIVGLPATSTLESAIEDRLGAHQTRTATSWFSQLVK